jgi:hypothetical protein
MQNINNQIILGSRASVMDRLEALIGPNYYWANNCKDFLENISSVNYPEYKRLFFPKKIYRDIGYVMVRNVGITLRQENPFVTRVKLHDTSGEIDLFWTDGPAFEKAREEYIEQINAELGLEEAKKQARESHYQNNELLTVNDIKLSYLVMARNFIIRDWDREHLACTNMTLYSPAHQPQEIRARQGIRDDDWAHEVIFAYLIKHKVAHVCRIQKSEMTRPRRVRDIAIKQVREIDGALIPGLT